MRKSNDQLFYSATDLCNHLECSHLTNLNRIDLETPIPKDKPDEQSQIIFARGLAHEKRYLENLRQRGKSIIDLSQVSEDKDRRRATLDALKSGADVLFQAYLEIPPFAGYADFLLKAKEPSTLGDYSYEVFDTKLALHSQPYFVIQLCLYSELLAQVQGRMPEKLHVVLGDDRHETFLSRDFYYYFTQLKEEFLEYVNASAESYPEPCPNCGTCLFRTYCENRRLADDHLSQVADMRSSQIRKLSTAGVTTLKALAETDLSHVKGIGDGALGKLKTQAQLQLHKRQTGEDKFVMLQPASSTKGLHLLPESDPGDLFFDIEGDPFYPEGLEYLFGVYFVDEQKSAFRDMWSHNHREERKSFEQLMDFFMERLTRFPRMHIYHYAAYEESAIKRLMSKYGTRENEVDHLLRQKVLVDLYKVVRHSLLTSESGYSIKNLEHFYSKGREAEVKTASASIVYYEKYILTLDRKYLEDIKDYNLEDCRSLLLLRDWLADLRSHAKLEIPPVPEQKVFSDRQNEHQQKLEEFELALTRDLPEDESLFSPKQHLDQLVFELADFYRREAKPAWWRMFSRQAMTSEEIVEDGDCIGGLQLLRNVAPVIIKRSAIYSYSFPEQDYKMRQGDVGLVAETLTNAGTIHAIDPDTRIIQFKRSIAKGALPECFDLVPQGPITTDPLKASLWRFIDEYVAAKVTGRRPFSAILDLLERRNPNIGVITSGAPLYQVESLNPLTCVSIAERMQNTYLFIQGPPGTGKTYTASHMILHLLRDGKKIGVTANSHKAIHNLLDAVEARAVESKYSFIGMKKSSGMSEDSIYESDNFRSVTANEDISANIGHVQLVAGTAWLFADPELNQTLDYLFVDEAGQLSLANFVAAGTSARNIVLIGDQMQLAQPSQGVHPGDSGKSVLDYLLQGRHTIPVEEGILLNTTYRMHPNICRFVSDAIYDGRIKSHPDLSHQAIIKTDNSNNSLPSSGIVCHFVSHEGRSQRSEEEAEHIREVYGHLLGMKYRDSKGKTRDLSGENILVVSPYNMQVNLLTEKLGAGARVGTVDKFQGQEAEVVLISMASSNSDEIPRGIEFLYSQNRLNVSVSRAKTLAIVVLSSKLLNVRCNSIEQMRLVNTLCRLMAYSKRAEESLYTT